MTSREIVQANICGKDAPRPALHFNNGRLNDFASGGVGAPVGYTQKKWQEGNFEYYDDIWGNIWRRMNYEGACKGGEVFKPAIEDWNELDGFAIPRFERESAAKSMLKGFNAKPDAYRVVNLPGWIFAQARYIRKMDNYFMDMVLVPERLHALHGKLAGMYEGLLIAAGDAKADAIFFCEDMGTQNGLLFSPALWDEYFKGIYTRLFGLAHSLGISVIMHSCGNNRRILDSLLQAGVNCFQFDQPAIYDFDDLGALLAKYNAALWSPVDIQKVLPTGNRQRIEAEVTRMYDAFKGRLVFGCYGDLQGIGVKPEWDAWAYNKILEYCQPTQTGEHRK